MGDRGYTLSVLGAYNLGQQPAISPVPRGAWVLIGLGALMGFGLGWYARQFTPGP